jgi:hypothetical protein
VLGVGSWEFGVWGLGSGVWCLGNKMYEARRVWGLGFGV